MHGHDAASLGWRDWDVILRWVMNSSGVRSLTAGFAASPRATAEIEFGANN
jgi:hypothetical protein